MSGSNTNSIPPPGERFKLTLISLASMMSREIENARHKGIDTIPKGIINLGIELIKNTEGDIIIGGFVTRSFGKTPNGYNNYWDKIKLKDQNFFMNGNNSSLLFGELSSAIVDGFIKLVKEKYISEQMMNNVWQHLHAMVKMSISFVYFERKPQKYNTNDGFSIKYTNRVREHINLEEEANKWGIDLTQTK